MAKYIKSKENELIKYIKKLMNSSSFRKSEGKFVIEGLRLCSDAAVGGVNIDTVLLTERAAQKHSKKTEKILENCREHCFVSDEIAGYISDTETPQGIICLCSLLDKQFSMDTIDISGKYIALENIQDPTNLGTIIRTAAALGVYGMILSVGCCDIYNPKVLRGSMGALFKVPFLRECDMDLTLKNLKEKGFNTYAAVLNDAAIDVKKVTFGGSSICVIGNEGNGLTDKTVESCTHKVTIKMTKDSESLNASVAAGILMWEMMKGG